MDNSSELSQYSDDVAIIGMSGRFPGARNIEQFWQNLRDGVESISSFSDDELRSSDIDDDLLNNPQYIKAGAILSDAEMFDASFFGFTPREAEITDPQHRFFLECAWEALENAGYDPRTYDGAIGVYASTSLSTYLLFNLYSNQEIIDSTGRFQILIGNDKDHLATRISYKLDLKGPSVTVQTACSSSLVAVHFACQSLLNRECDMALAGGVTISVPQKAGYLYQEGGIASPDGHCRAFDANAQGTLNGSGVGIIVVKRLEDAVNDGDTIHAIIKGTAINNDGSSKVGYTAPSVDGQANVVAEALSMAGVVPETITYIEAHGTGTPLGDPIEIAALTKVYGSSMGLQHCAIGSVKTNIGHLDAAAGITGLIKTVLALKHKLLPPSLHFAQPNPNIDFINSPFYVNTELRTWPETKTPRRAGVSAFGIGGTNAHVILEEAPLAPKSAGDQSAQLLVLSAKSGNALETMTDNLADYLQQHPEINLAEVAYTLQVGRHAFDHRRILACRDVNEASDALKKRDNRRLLSSEQSTARKPIIFMFPGQGTQYVQMAMGLYREEQTFREDIDYCAEFLKPLLNLDLRELLCFTKDSFEGPQKLEQTFITQPVLFMIEYALALLWMRKGIQPEAMIGHSIGEYVAACIAGVFSLDDALRLVAVRGSLMQNLPEGAMLAVPLPEDEVIQHLNADLSLAAINTPDLCVVSGTFEAVETLRQRLAGEGIECRQLHTSHAFHSQMMDTIVEPFAREVAAIQLQAPQRPFISNVTGTWITEKEATDPNYWAKHLRQTVLFSQGLHEILRTHESILLEVGPGQTLSTIVRQHPDRRPGHTLVNSTRQPHDYQPDDVFFYGAIGRLWLAGIDIDWHNLHRDSSRRRIPLPTYPFEHQRYWIDPKKDIAGVQAKLEKETDFARWFYVPSWRRVDILEPGYELVLNAQRMCWLIFADEEGLGHQLGEKLEKINQQVVLVTKGDHFVKLDNFAYALRPSHRDDYQFLLRDLQLHELVPQKILHLWSVSSQETMQRSMELSALSQSPDNDSFYSLLFLAQALAERNITDPLFIGVVSSNLQEVTGEEILDPRKATILSPCRVLPQEYANITCRNIDIISCSSDKGYDHKCVDQLIQEAITPSADAVVAYRGKYRWVEAFVSVHMDSRSSRKTALREEGVYLITGGLGRIGLTIAEYLAKTVRAKLVLVGRSTFPQGPEQEIWLAQHDAQDNISQKIRKLQALKKFGAEVLIITADVADQHQMQGVINATYEHFGQLHGVVHAAGIVGEHSVRSIQEIDMAECERQFRPKIQGSVVLERVLQNRNLDFCLCMSSLSSILGGLGFIAYTAANQFIDVFARNHNHRNSIPWISVNWDGWQLEEAGNLRGVGMQVAKLAMSPAEGLEVLRYILQANVQDQIIISTGDLQERQNWWIESKNVKQYEAENSTSTFHSRPSLPTSFVAPRNELEQTIADIWQKYLGIEQVGIYDNFFELGGHSLVATLIISQLRKALNLELPLRAFFESATIADLVTVIEKEQQGENTNREPALVPLARETRRIQRTSQGELKEIVPPAVNDTGAIDKKAQVISTKESERRTLQFSLMFFSADASYISNQKYRLLLESAKYADQHGFSAIWLPERHFHDFGGLYPNPSVIGAAIAGITKNVHIRAGSVVVPLQHPVRIAEEWSVIDNLSGGRVGVSFASGWHVNDFVLAPEVFAQHKTLMFEGIEKIHRLWQGEPISMLNGAGNVAEVRIFPRPVQKQLPTWLTCISMDTFVAAGKMGAYVLTSLLSQNVNELHEKISAYRKARLEHGFDPEGGHVTLMLHTYVGRNMEDVRAKAGPPYFDYIRSNMELQASNAIGLGMPIDRNGYTEKDTDYLAANKFEKMCGETGLVGTPEICLRLLHRLREAGVNEIACLIDFINDFEVVMPSIHLLNELKGDL